MRMLLVEDTEDVAEPIVAAFSRHGHAVDHMATREAAEEALAVQDYDLIVLDLNMPGIDGWTVAALIRKHKPTAAIPILVITGLMNNAEQAACRAGATAFCLKPFDARRLVAEVRRLCPLPGS